MSVFAVLRQTQRLRVVPFALVAVLAASGTPPVVAFNNSLYQNTDGFDTCASKSQTMLNAWWNGTPWLDIGQ